VPSVSATGVGRGSSQPLLSILPRRVPAAQTECTCSGSKECFAIHTKIFVGSSGPLNCRRRDILPRVLHIWWRLILNSALFALDTSDCSRLCSQSAVPLAAAHFEPRAAPRQGERDVTGARTSPLLAAAAAHGAQMRGRPSQPVRLFDDGLGTAYGQRKGSPPGTKRGFFLVIAVAVIVGSELRGSHRRRRCEARLNVPHARAEGLRCGSLAHVGVH
jgi:hypothetical protein